MVTHWVHLIARKKTMEALDLVNLVRGDKCVCVHDRDSNDFMSKAKFVCYILKQTNNVEPMHRELLDEMAIRVIDHIVEDKDQGPPKESGPHGWYCHLTTEQILRATERKTMWLSPELKVRNSLLCL
jgi:hypothetical protein